MLLRGIEQVAIVERLPSKFVCPDDLVSAQEIGERRGSISIEQDFHATAAGDSRERFA